MNVLAYGYTGPDAGPVFVLFLLAVLAVLVGVGSGVSRLRSAGTNRRYRERLAAVADAVGRDAVCNVDAVTAATRDLFARFWPAWTSTGHAQLAELGTADLVADWTTTLANLERDGARMYATVRNGPDIDVVAASIATAFPPRGVSVRVRATLYAYVIMASGQHASAPGAEGNKNWAYDALWTLTYFEGRWVIASIRLPMTTREIMDEPLGFRTATDGGLTRKRLSDRGLTDRR